MSDDWFGVRRAPVNLFRGEEDLGHLIKRAKKESYGVVIFDTLQRMVAGADQDSAADAASSTSRWTR